MKKFASILVVLIAMGIATLAVAQSTEKSEGKATVQSKSGDGGFSVQAQGEKRDSAARSERTPQADTGEKGAQGPAGEPGPQGAPGPQGPAGPAGGGFLGMDPTLALLVGLGVLAVVIVAIVAASRGGREI